MLATTRIINKTLNPMVILNSTFSIPRRAEKIVPGSLPPPRLPIPTPRFCNTTQITVTIDVIISAISKKVFIPSPPQVRQPTNYTLKNSLSSMRSQKFSISKWITELKDEIEIGKMKNGNSEIFSNTQYGLRCRVFGF